MRDPFRWSINLGCWGIPRVRLHVFFVAFAAATYFLSWQDSGDAAGNLAATATVAMVVLLLSALAHEWGHWVVAHRYGIAPLTLVVAPLGGVSRWPRRAADSPGVTASLLAGPAANLLICLVGLAIVRLTWSDIELGELLNPLSPVWGGRSSSPVQRGVLLSIWINWLLFLVNLLPAFPFDGGGILRRLVSVLRPGWTRNRVVETVFWGAVSLSTVLMALALILFKHEADAIFPTSYALLLLAVVLFLGARQEVEECAVQAGMLQGSEPMEGEDSGGRKPGWGPPPNASSTASKHDGGTGGRDVSNVPGFVEGTVDGETPAEEWDRAPDVAELRTDAELEAEEERRVDAILSRLHVGGLECLTGEEREVLQRASARYRSRSRP
ncbi:MAG: metalloprotease [Planctomycetota bacterium]